MLLSLIIVSDVVIVSAKSVFLNALSRPDVSLISSVAKWCNCSNTVISRNWDNKSFLSRCDFSIKLLLSACNENAVNIKSLYVPR